MAKIYRILTATIGLMLLLGACKDNATMVQIGLAQEYQTLEFSCLKEQKTIQITSTGEWYLNSSDPTWCTTSHTIGEGEQYVNIYVTRNTTGNDRNTVLTLSAIGSDNILINVKQKPNELPDYEEAIGPDKTNMSDLSGIDLSKQMGPGVNIGNTFEAGWITDTGEADGDETAWGNAQPHLALFQDIKSAGFNCVRIPIRLDHSLVKDGVPDVTWTIDDYEIADEWLDKIETSVSEAIQAGLFVIIDMHESYWMEELTYDEEDYLKTRLEGYWKQLALRFRNYDYHLIFAGVNEVQHADTAWGADPTEENLDVFNSMLQTFVNAVRATGGRNYYRYLVAPAYVTSADYAVRLYETPGDVIPDRIFCEIHTYNPYTFSLQETISDDFLLWGKPFYNGTITYNSYTYNDALYNKNSWGMEDAIYKSISDLKTHLIDNGVPVLVGEYIGGQKRESLKTQNLEMYELVYKSRMYYTWFQTYCIHTNGLVPIYWCAGGDIVNAAEQKVRYEEGLIDPIMTAMRNEQWVVNLDD